MKSLLRNKKGGLTDLFIFMVVGIIIIFISGIFIYMGGKASDQLHETMDGMDLPSGQNTTQVLNDTFDQVPATYNALYWISLFLIVGMIISIFIGSYLVTTKPVFFVPYIFITIIATIVSVGLSNAYESVIENTTVASTFAGFTGSNFIMLNLPMWIAIIGIVGGIIMFVRMGSKDDEIYGGGHYGG